MGVTKRRIWWEEFRAPELVNLDPGKTIAVLPLAAIEQHGPHLPLSTDTSIMRGMIDSVVAQLPETLDARFLPVQSVGKSNEHQYAPGTLTLEATTAIRAWTEIGDSLARAGVRKLVLITSHGGNEEIMGIVTREMRVEHKMMAVKTSWMRFGFPQGMFSELEMAQGIHGGDIETSLMLHFCPELVDMDSAQNFRSRVADAQDAFAFLKPTGAHAFAWTARDLHTEGVVGDAANATAQKGELTARHQAKGFVSLLQDIAKADVDEWVCS